MTTHNSQDYLQPSDFESFQEAYKIKYFSKTKKWIGFHLRNRRIKQQIKSDHHSYRELGYKIHIVIPKREDYKQHLAKVIDILSEYQFKFKIDAHLKKEKSGARAFTVYQSHLYHANWYEAFRRVDDYLSSVLEGKKTPSLFSSDKRAKRLLGMKYVRYRNDKDQYGHYCKEKFDEKIECFIDNPFRPDLVNVLQEVYSDKKLYKWVASQLFNNMGYSEFLIRLHHENEENFLNLLGQLADNAPLCSIISNLCWYGLTHDHEQSFVIAEHLVNYPEDFKLISDKLNNKFNCPAYHELIQPIKRHKALHKKTLLSYELDKIEKTVEAVTVHALYTGLIEQKTVDESKAKQNIATEINVRLVNNDNLKVYQSIGARIGAGLLNVLHTIPFIGWGIGMIKYYKTGSFWYSQKGKTRSQKQIESQLTEGIESAPILNFQ